MDKFFETIFTPPLYVQSDWRVMRIILRYVRWGTHRPPPPPGGTPAADRPTHLPPIRTPKSSRTRLRVQRSTALWSLRSLPKPPYSKGEGQANEDSRSLRNLRVMFRSPCNPSQHDLSPECHPAVSSLAL